MAAYLAVGVAWCAIRAVLTANAPLGLVSVVAAIGSHDTPLSEKIWIPMFLGWNVVVPIVAWPLDIALGLSVGPHGIRGHDGHPPDSSSH
jgi:hypothetical protein